MKRIWLITLFLIPIYITIGCSTTQYAAPEKQAADQTSVTLDRPYDDAWSDLISYTSQRFFAIDSYEKESGLMTLSFTGDISRFVDCGKVGAGSGQEGWVESWIDGNGTTLSLDGRMNLTVEEVNMQETAVEINTRYVLTATNPYPLKAPEKTYEWVFNTGGSDTVRDGPIGGPLTCVPTHEAENLIVEGVTDSD